MKKYKKLKIALIFSLGFITPIIIIILLLSYLTFNSSSLVTNIKTNIVDQVNNVTPTSSLITLYNAANKNSEDLKHDLIVQLAVTKDDYITKMATLNSFKTERIEMKINNIEKISTLVTNIDSFKTNLIANSDGALLIKNEISNINEIITALQNNNLDHIAQSFIDLKNTLIAYELNLSLTDEQKALVKNEIVKNATDKIKHSDLVTNIKNLAPSIIEFINYEHLTTLDKEYIINSENEMLKQKLQETHDALLMSESTIVELENDVISLENEINSKNNEILLLNEEIKKLNNNIDTTKKVINAQSEIINTGSSKITNLENEIINLNNTNIELQNQVTSLTPITYENFEDYIFSGSTSPFLSDVSIDKIENIEIIKDANANYQLITIIGSQSLTTSEIYKITAHLSEQLYATNYVSNITLVFQPNNQTIKLYPDAIVIEQNKDQL